MFIITSFYTNRSNIRSKEICHPIVYIYICTIRIHYFELITANLKKTDSTKILPRADCFKILWFYRFIYSLVCPNMKSSSVDAVKRITIIY